jgi:hypothetical protein
MKVVFDEFAEIGQFANVLTRLYRCPIRHDLRLEISHVDLEDDTLTADQLTRTVLVDLVTDLELLVVVVRTTAVLVVVVAIVDFPDGVLRRSEYEIDEFIRHVFRYRNRIGIVVRVRLGYQVLVGQGRVEVASLDHDQEHLIICNDGIQ